MAGSLLFALLVMLSVLLAFVAMWRMFGGRDPVEQRLAEYGAALDGGLADGSPGRRVRLPLLNRLLAGFSFGPRLAEKLMRADLSMTAAEYGLVILSAGMAGLVLGTVRVGLLFGAVLGLALGYLPILYLNRRANRRRRAFTEQIPDILTLLVGALRAGYGLTQAMGLLIDQMDQPASKEFARVMQAITLGLPVQRGLADMAERMSSTDWDMVVTAINVQYDTGGNLAQTLETIGETVKDRIRLLRDIRVMTAQQRLTGYVLAGVPIVVALIMFVIAPQYIRRLFEPGWIRLLPIMATVMAVIGFLIIRRIVDIDV
jgi:tight adherence protein B